MTGDPLQRLVEHDQRDLIDAIDAAIDDLSFRRDRDYDAEDLPGVDAKLDRWSMLRTRLSDPELA